jgi:REP element-mobilizing transposase RayT
MDETRSKRSVVSRCRYYVGWYPKYRRPVIERPIQWRLTQIIGEVCAQEGAPILELETMPDQGHLLPPAIRTASTASSRQ